jgi:nitrite reductase/ring-hydroxylating ferredoxin subunit
MPRAELQIAEIPYNVPFRLEHEDLNIVIVRTDRGISAFEDVCPHAFWPLSDGCVRDGLIECPGHAWEFDVANGKCLTAPAYALTRIESRIVGETLHLEWREKVRAVNG